MNLLQFVQEPNGKLSTTRLAFIGWSIVVCSVWATVSIQKHAVQPIDSSIVTVIGILMTGKYLQRNIEENKSPPTTPTP